MTRDERSEARRENWFLYPEEYQLEPDRGKRSGTLKGCGLLAACGVAMGLMAWAGARAVFG